MAKYKLKIILRSDATFGRGDGVVGWVDIEVQHDELGCPFLGGREIKGLLVIECADILAALPLDAFNGDISDGQECNPWKIAARYLFGMPGSRKINQGCLSITAAELPDDLRDGLRHDLRMQLEKIHTRGRAEGKNDGEVRELGEQYKNAFRIRTLESLTCIRRQTALDENGIPLEHRLHSSRVIIRETPFVSTLEYTEMGDKKQDRVNLELLSACVRAFRHAGLGRNRKGRLEAFLMNEDGTETIFFDGFKKEFGGVFS